MDARLYFRAAMVSIVALIFSVCILGTLEVRESVAQTSTVDGYITKEEAYRLKKLFEKPSGGSGSAAMAARQRAMTVAARARWVGASRLLVTRGGLAGVAAGIWVHNGVTLYYGLQGQPDPVALHLSPEFRQAELALGASGAGGVMKYHASDGTLTGSGMVTFISYDFVAPNNCTVRIEFAGSSTATTSAKYIGNAGMERITGLSGGCGVGILANVEASQSTSSPYVNSNTDSANGSRTYRFYTRNTRGSDTSTRYFGPEITSGQNGSWQNPVFDMGPGTILEAPPSGGAMYTAQPQTTEEFYRDVQQEGCPTGTVASPEAPTVPEVCPDYFPEEWEEEFPDVGEPGPRDDPYADPDEDGQPNHSDPDDDGDGIPDEDDPQPYVNPQGPEGDPDEDGTPNEDDADDDNDDIPDEDDPQPYVPTDPTTLPDDHPYADPDEDGIPNRDDSDDDNDGIPDEDDPEPQVPNEPSDLPDYHPEADPDEDGDPNRTDRDDDGDGADDWKDSRPFSPAVPTNPESDEDDDGVPDYEDPWPGNPYAPYNPSRDTDGDDVPDFQDPEITDRNVPWSPSGPSEGSSTRRGPVNDPDVPTNPVSPPWNPGDPGSPNIPNEPSNPNVPKTPQTPQNPLDPSTPNEPRYPVAPNEPDDPTTEETPDVPASPPPPKGPLLSCPVEKKPPSIIVPPVDFEEKFPFSLILGALSVLDMLTGTPEAPTFDLPMIGVVDLSRFDSGMAVMRTVFLVLIGGILMPVMFYRLIRGGGE